MRNKIVSVWEMPWLITGGSNYYTQLELPDKGRSIKGLVVVASTANYHGGVKQLGG